ncbi:DUF6607 family protein [Formosa sp. L2A11]|uniref:DUF6607 family protein n=1 Tax=Formosa sp. L2A11 TaxID=2686363 RepID=UPI00131DA205|nr:DUF6607 family protein [Formosa sp. L2A11]
MKRIILVALCILGFSTSKIFAQEHKKEDQKAIKDMCGCHEVTFNFAETFNYVNDSTYMPSETKHDKGLEWVELVEDADNKIVLQHLLIVGNPASPHIVKHWRQDWEYENTDLYIYNGDNEWSYKSLPKTEVKGQWSQKVFQVDDSPRYEGSSSWVHVDGKSYWENTTTAPLPRREYTKRSDYNITLRRNRQEITKTGWIHDQDNDKIIREAGKEDVVIAQEKGFNTYTKVDDSKCIAAQDYWKKTSAKWALVRAKWDAIFARDKDLNLEEKVDNKQLYKYLFSDTEYQNESEINEVIESFVKK